MSAPEKYVSMEEIIDHIGIKRDTVIKYIHAEGLPAIKIGRLRKASK